MTQQDKATRTKRAWRYQPVYVEIDGERVYSLCEVYIDQDGTLDSWTENMAMAPHGNDIEELSKDLVLMLTDVYRWEPVLFAGLRIGMMFRRQIDQKQSEALAGMVEAYTHNCRQIAVPPSDAGKGE